MFPSGIVQSAPRKLFHLVRATSTLNSDDIKMTSVLIICCATVDARLLVHNCVSIEI